MYIFRHPVVVCGPMHGTDHMALFASSNIILVITCKYLKILFLNNINTKNNIKELK